MKLDWAPKTRKQRALGLLQENQWKGWVSEKGGIDRIRVLISFETKVFTYSVLPPANQRMGLAVVKQLFNARCKFETNVYIRANDC